jgi:hypothetical protein
VRLIDLSKFSAKEQNLRLYIPREGETGQYAALSYCWGYSQPVTTKDVNLLRHLRKISYDNLAQTLQDAIKTTKAMGIRFLWIDALCVVQNSERDKQREIAKMAKIYQNTYFTIVAACSTSSAEGFLQVRDGLPPALEIPVGCGDGKIGSIALLPTYESLRHESLHERAWTLQEMILSRRLLIFRKDSVGWKCEKMDRGLYRWTDWNGYCASTGLTTIRFAPDGKIVRPSLSIYSADISSFSNPSHSAERQPYIYRLWRDVVKDYSTRLMTNEGDKLSAIAGIVAYFEGVMNDVYLAGLWTRHLMQELSWHVYNAKRPAKARAPSWSWMALDGPVTFQADYCKWYTPIIKVISCTVTPVSPTAPFSSVTGGALVLEGAFSSAIPFLTRRKQLCPETRDGFGMDSDQEQDENDLYMGIAQCVPTASYGKYASMRLTSTWGLILRPSADSSSTKLVYERVGWFNDPFWIHRNRIKRGAVTII